MRQSRLDTMQRHVVQEYALDTLLHTKSLPKSIYHFLYDMYMVNMHTGQTCPSTKEEAVAEIRSYIPIEAGICIADIMDEFTRKTMYPNAMQKICNSFYFDAFFAYQAQGLPGDFYLFTNVGLIDSTAYVEYAYSYLYDLMQSPNLYIDQNNVLITADAIGITPEQLLSILVNDAERPAIENFGFDYSFRIVNKWTIQNFLNRYSEQVEIMKNLSDMNLLKGNDELEL